jgi:predicted RNase H-like HicB family nuclease
VDDILTHRYFVMIRRTRTGYCADVPDVDGCVSAGMTVEHTKQLIAEALEMHLELMHESGESIPPPRQKIEFQIDDDTGEEFCTWVDVKVPAEPEHTPVDAQL